MAICVRRRLRLMSWTSLLVVATFPSFGQEEDTPQSNDLLGETHRFVAEVFAPQPSSPRLPLTSDTEHARSIDPTLTEGAAIWIHEALPSPPLTVIGGRVFSYHDLVYDPLDAPVLKIRPIDDDQVIPFLIRVTIDSKGDLPEGASIKITFPAPPIFNPELQSLEAWSDGLSVPTEIDRSFEEATISIGLSLSRSPGTNLRDETTVMVQGELRLGAYRQYPRGWFSKHMGPSSDPDLATLARLEIGRDVSDAGEKERLLDLADAVAADMPGFDQVAIVNSWVGNRLRYQESSALRTATEALEDGSGDCDEHAAVALALLRALGIPARKTTGLLYNFDAVSPHAWLEAALPSRDGSMQWFIVDPTLAGTTPGKEKKAAFVQYRERILLYPVRPTVTPEGFGGRLTTDVFLNWRASGGTDWSRPSRAAQFMATAISIVDRQISSDVQKLVEGGLLLRRESASVIGSPYLVVDRPLRPGGSTRVHLGLENEERIVLDLTNADGSDLDPEDVARLREVYRDLNHLFFGGLAAFHNLELVYLRDPHSDRLHTVSLRTGRYILENFLDRILKRLTKREIITLEEAGRISAVAEASGGRNLYLLQELARQLPPDR